jgi:coatomer subunit beta'
MLDALESLQMAYPSPRRVTMNMNLQLRETVVVGKTQLNLTNSVYQIQRQLFARSERVKGIDFHPVEPWILTKLYSGMFSSAGIRASHADEVHF